MNELWMNSERNLERSQSFLVHWSNLPHCDTYDKLKNVHSYNKRALLNYQMKVAFLKLNCSNLPVWATNSKIDYPLRNSPAFLCFSDNKRGIAVSQDSLKW